MPSLVRDHVSFLQNDAILPAQYWYGGRNPSGCQKLLMAILDEVLVTLRATAAIRRHKADSLWNDAVAWVADEEDRYGSFVYCCHYLNLEPRRVRAVLREVRASRCLQFVTRRFAAHPAVEHLTVGRCQVAHLPTSRSCRMASHSSSIRLASASP